MIDAAQEHHKVENLRKGQGAGKAAHDAIVKAIETVLREGPRTRDLGGSASTTEIGKAIAALV